MRRMKRTVRIVSLVLVLVMALSMGANAATVTNISVSTEVYSDCKIQPQKTASGSLKDQTFSTVHTIDSDNHFCAFTDTVAYELVFSPSKVTDDFMVFMLKGPDGVTLNDLKTNPVVPNGNNIVYINQAAGAAKHIFEIYPSDLAVGTYVIFVSSKTDKFLPVATLDIVDGVSPSSFHFGNVNLDANNRINAADAKLILQHAVKTITLTGDALSAADVNLSGKANAADAKKILQYSVGAIITF